MNLGDQRVHSRSGERIADEDTEVIATCACRMARGPEGLGQQQRGTRSVQTRGDDENPRRCQDEVWLEKAQIFQHLSSSA